MSVLLTSSCAWTKSLDADQHAALMAVYDMSVPKLSEINYPRFDGGKDCSGSSTSCSGGKVVTLRLNDNQLQIVPTLIGILTGLKSLDLSKNQLRNVPSQIGLLTGLTNLFLHINQLMSVPTEIAKLTSVKTFYVCNNQLRGTPFPLNFTPGAACFGQGVYPGPTIETNCFTTCPSGCCLSTFRFPDCAPTSTAPPRLSSTNTLAASPPKSVPRRTDFATPVGKRAEMDEPKSSNAIFGIVAVFVAVVLVAIVVSVLYAMRHKSSRDRDNEDVTDVHADSGATSNNRYLAFSDVSPRGIEYGQRPVGKTGDHYAAGI